MKSNRMIQSGLSFAVAVLGVGAFVLFADAIPNTAEGAAVPAVSTTATSAMAAQNQQGKDPKIDPVKRDVHHEFGHVKYAKLESDEIALWEEIWEMTKGTSAEPWQSYVMPNGKIGNYYCVNAFEGFAVAFSYMKCGVEIDPVIADFINAVGD